MEPETTMHEALAVIAKELRAAANEGGHRCACEGVTMAGDAAVMALSGSCRAYRRMRRSIDAILPELERDRPEIAELVHFLLAIADRTCRAGG